MRDSSSRNRTRLLIVASFIDTIRSRVVVKVCKAFGFVARILARSITRKNRRARLVCVVLYVLSLSCHTKTLCACRTAWGGPFPNLSKRGE